MSAVWCTRMDTERVSRTVAEVQGVLTMREKLFTKHSVENMAAYRAMRRDGRITDDPFGDVFLVVDGWATVRADFDEHDETIRQIAARGLTYGIHVVLTTARWSDIHSQLRDQLGTRLELRLGDAIDSVIDMRAAQGVPKQPGRGLTPDKLHFLAAVPRIDGWQRTDDLSDAARSLAETVADSWNGRRHPGSNAARGAAKPPNFPRRKGSCGCRWDWANRTCSRSGTTSPSNRT